jgi:hypothetical protein
LGRDAWSSVVSDDSNKRRRHTTTDLNVDGNRSLPRLNGWRRGVAVDVGVITDVGEPGLAVGWWWCVHGGERGLDGLASCQVEKAQWNVLRDIVILEERGYID